MGWGDVAAYLGRTFLDDSGLPSPDVVLGILFTAISFVIGWAASRNGSQRKLKAQIVDELVLSHSELKSRAYPTRWREDDLRETWMLDPFVARLKFLYGTLHQGRYLTRSQLDAIEYYIMRVEDFIAKWAEVRRRNEGYHQTFDIAYRGLRDSVFKIDRSQLRRLAGLGRPQDTLFTAAAALAPPQSIADNSLVPAE